MKEYLEIHPWKIIEKDFHPDFNETSESIFSLGNGRMGQRANFEEHFSGKSLQGNYFAGVYYPDKTRVGWWKNGYPDYFAKVLNSVNWAGINMSFGEEKIDLAQSKISSFERTLDMRHGLLQRTVAVDLKNRGNINFQTERFCSMHDQEVGAIRIQINTNDFEGKLTLTSYLDFDVVNQDSNYNEQFWIPESHENIEQHAYLQAKTKKTDFHVGSAMTCSISKNGVPISPQMKYSDEAKYVGQNISIDVNQNDVLTIIKYVANSSSRYIGSDHLKSHLTEKVTELKRVGYAELLDRHSKVWLQKWENADIIIEGDLAAQQAIRFNIFHLFQTYTGDDARLNIGPKGFTGEKYGGSTYWDTEAYCMPFYLGTCDSEVGLNLLKYRYQHLQKAQENAEKLGFNHGAALYPMVTMNGEECHNEWEITFEEIHRNGAIAYAIYNYIQYTGDHSYLYSGGLSVLIGIARFWKQRFNFSEAKNQYVMLGVTGPNEYENNVNNNWYTNYIARWCLQYTADQIAIAKSDGKWKDIAESTHFEEVELIEWHQISSNVYLPHSREHGVFLQQEGYLDKEQILVQDLPDTDRPLNQKWSWDRILRSCFIKQADVLQGFYFFEDDFTEEELRRNFLFYEPRTVHESSLSPCIHSIQAAQLGMKEKAYEMYLRTSRLDLDDYNNDTKDGCHITSMAGTWMSIVEGFGGVRTRKGELSIQPMLPKQWKKFSFKLNYRGRLIQFEVGNGHVNISNLNGPDLNMVCYGENIFIPSGQIISCNLKD